MNVLIVSLNMFPNGDAGAIRDDAFAKIYRELGHKVSCICGLTIGDMGLHNSISYQGVAEPGLGLLKQIKSQLLAAKRLKEAMSLVYSESEKSDLIHFVSQNPLAAIWLKHYAKLHNNIMLYACVEWYSPLNYRGGRLSIPYLINHWLNRHYVTPEMKVIAISNFFEQYFANKGNQVIRIPVIMDKADYTPNLQPNENGLTIAYVGSPFRKDSIYNIIEALASLTEAERAKITFCLAGVTEEDVYAICSNYGIDANKVLPRVYAYGRLPREEALAVVKKADFSILIRPENEVYAEAGFPTKFVEAMMNGTPVLCNITSDIALYLQDGKNGISINSDNTADIVTAMRRALRMTINEKADMRQAALITAYTHFDYRRYSSEVMKLLQTTKGINRC